MNQTNHSIDIDHEYNVLLSSLRIGVSKHVVNEDFTVLWANDYFYEMTGYGKAEFEEKFHSSCRRFFAEYPMQYKRISDAVTRALKNGHVGYDALCEMPRKDGSTLWFRFVGTFTDEVIEGLPVIYVVYTDVDELVRTRLDAQQEHETLSDTLKMEEMTIDCIKQMYEAGNMKSYMGDLLKTLGACFRADRAYLYEVRGEKMYNIYEWCADGVPAKMNFCQNLNISLLSVWKERFLCGESVVIHSVEELKTIYPKAYNVLCEQGITSLILSPIHIKDHLYGFIGVDNPDLSRAVNVVMMETFCYFISISVEKIRLNEKLIYNSFYDELTGLYNRNKYLQDIDTLRKQHQPLGILYMDINGLKDINDNLGHTYGDNILIQGAEMLKKVFTDANIYRIGGDEFVVLMTGVSEDEFTNLVVDLKKYILLSPECKGAVGHTWANDGVELDRKITDADEYMYQDKMHYYRNNPNSNRYRYYNDNIIKLAEKATLQKALSDGKFEVYLQPKVDFERKVIGGEALIRYHDEEGCLIFPNEFIPSLEEARIIRYVDFYVFEKICQQLQEWHSRGIPTYPLSVNFSRYTLRLPDFITQLEQIWNKYQVDKHMLEIEIIENDENVDNKFLVSIMERIKKAGYAISIDDFGVRYSNMALFINAQLDTLKIDKSLMNGIEENKRSQLLISSLVQICHNLDMQLIVEGVETQQQFNILKGLECDGIQGYLISRPVTIQQFESKFLLSE